MVQKYPMTLAGFEALQEELEHLKNTVRPRIVKAIAEAREHGDLRENAEYHAAREEHGFNEGRIQEVEHKLSHAHVINVTEMPNTGRVIFGVTVNLINSDTDDKVTYQLVGEDEADIKVNKISITSPIARALVGKEVGDIVVVQAPGGDIEYEIVEVEHV